MLTCTAKGGYNGTQYLVFWFSQFNAVMFLVDIFCNCFNSTVVERAGGDG